MPCPSKRQHDQTWHGSPPRESGNNELTHRDRLERVTPFHLVRPLRNTHPGPSVLASRHWGARTRQLQLSLTWRSTNSAPILFSVRTYLDGIWPNRFDTQTGTAKSICSFGYRCHRHECLPRNVWFGIAESKARMADEQKIQEKRQIAVFSNSSIIGDRPKIALLY